MPHEDNQDAVETRPADRPLGVLFWCVLLLLSLIVAGAVFVYFFNSNFSRHSPENNRYIRINGALEDLKTQLQMYEVMNDGVPSTEQGLGALVRRPSGQPVPRKWSQLLLEIPTDPWNTPYQYRYPATKSTKEAYDLFSAGKDRQPNTLDDIGNW